MTEPTPIDTELNRDPDDLREEIDYFRRKAAQMQADAQLNLLMADSLGDEVERLQRLLAQVVNRRNGG